MDTVIMSRLETLLYCLFFVLAIFCYKSLIPAPIINSETKISEKMNEEKQLTKQEQIDLSKREYDKEVKDLAYFMSFMTTIMFFGFSLCPNATIKEALGFSLFSNLALFLIKQEELWWDHRDRVEFGIK